MANRDETATFLNDFHVKMSIWGIVFRDDRGKNTQTLFDLDITGNDRIEVLKTLQADDYSEGPLLDTLNNGADMWVFGKVVNSKEVYIKITMGVTGMKVICISFHVAGYKMDYPYRKKD